MRAASLLALLAAVLLAGAAPARRPPSDRALVTKGLVRAVASGGLSAEEAAGYRATVGRLPALARKLPPLRARELKGLLHDIALQWRSYTRPRALTLFSMLDFDERYLASHRLPYSGTDAQDEDGIVYRYFPGHGLVFHPLGEFTQLNNDVSLGDVDATETLAQALLQRTTEDAHRNTRFVQ